MRTRKRIREKEEKTKPSKPVILDPEDFIDEDYQEAMRLIEKYPLTKMQKLKEPSMEDKLSTESDQEHKHTSTPSKSEVSQESSGLPKRNHGNTRDIRRKEVKELGASEKNQLMKTQPSNQEKSNSEDVAKTVKQPAPTKKRDLKELKIKQGFEDFLSLVAGLNNSKAPSQNIQGMSQNESVEEVKKEVSEQRSQGENSDSSQNDEKEQQTYIGTTDGEQRQFNSPANPEHLKPHNDQTGSKETHESAFHVGEQAVVMDSQNNAINNKQSVVQNESQALSESLDNCTKTSSGYPLIYNQ